MAAAKKCDICGKLYEEYNYKQNKNEPNGFMFLNIDNQRKYYSGDVTDCCPHCMAAIKTNIDILKNRGEVKKPGEVTWGDIFDEFEDNYPDFVGDVDDWRPYCPPYRDEILDKTIILWMMDGTMKRYSYLSKKLYPEEE